MQMTQYALHLAAEFNTQTTLIGYERIIYVMESSDIYFLKSNPAMGKEGHHIDFSRVSRHNSVGGVSGECDGVILTFVHKLKKFSFRKMKTRRARHISVSLLKCYGNSPI